MIGIIILGGPTFDQPSDFPSDRHAFVICADGGIKKARQWGITPHVVVGDFDSSNLTDIEKDNITIRQFPKEKDFTDGEIAIRCALEQDISELIIYGKFAGRFDHVLSGVMLMRKVAVKNIPVSMVDGQNTVIYHLPGKRVLSKTDFPYFSLLPIDAQLEGVSIEGAKYPLDQVTLKREETWGISNEWLEDEVVITTKRGDAIIVMSKD